MLFVTILGTLASVFAIPLAIYFYIKENDNKKDRVRRDIIKILLLQLNETNTISKTEIISVCHSKCRENKISRDSYRFSEISEDLLSEVISNPLIKRENRSVYIKDLQSIIERPNEAASVCMMALSGKGKTESAVGTPNPIISDDIEKLNSLEKRTKQEDLSRFYIQTLGVLFSIISFLAIGLTSTGDFFQSLLNDVTFISVVLSGLGIAVVSLIIAAIYKKMKSKLFK